MRINFAHVRVRGVNGSLIDVAVFDARSRSGTNADNASLLGTLTARARASRLKVDQSALAYSEGGQVKYYGTPALVKYLAQSGIPSWTNSIAV